jgi:tetratricopeptide (TPR) repeat protein
MPSPSRNAPAFLAGPLVVLLIVGAIVTAGAGVALSASALVEMKSGSSWLSATSPIYIIAISFALALFQLSLAVVIRLLAAHLSQAKYEQAVMDQLRTSVLQIEQVARSRASPLVSGNAPVAQPISAIPDGRLMPAQTDGQQMLIELRDLLLMNDHQRATASRRHWDQRKEDHIRMIERAIAMDDWEHSQALVAELQSMLPDDPIGEEMAQRVESEQGVRRRNDLEAARSQIRHMISVNGWGQAEETTQRLERRYPRHPDVEILRMELAAEREAFERENLQRLFNELREASEQRQWRRAMLVAEELLRRYPDDKQVSRLQLDLPTLRENAEAQERREEEALFKELLQRQRYDEAIGVAQHLISRFPTSSAAAELNRLLPKVEELSRQEQQKRNAQAPQAV